jgi:hypothetical protein
MAADDIAKWEAWWEFTQDPARYDAWVADLQYEVDIEEAVEASYYKYLRSEGE